MTSCDSLSKIGSSNETTRYVRLAATSCLRGAALQRWRSSAIAVIGAGALGSRLAPELVRSGVEGCTIYDPDVVSLENLGTQAFTAAGGSKAEELRAACEAIRPGVAVARPVDVRHAGIGELARASAFVDATDDPKLGWTLTEISNGLGKPMLRIAVDGSGEREMGRVQVSHGGAGHACRVCPKSLAELMRFAPRTPCPGSHPDGPPPTLAGIGTNFVMVGVGLVQLQRLLGGNETRGVVDSQIIVDLDQFQMFAMVERRSEKCLSGHISWQLIAADCGAAETTLGDLFQIAARAVGRPVDALEPYGHPLCLAARCQCGSVRGAVGTRWAVPPRCRRCRRPMAWELHTRKPAWTLGEAKCAGILDRTPADLGLPAEGAMIIVRRGGAPPARLVLR